jgi:hypothetical protein
LFTTNNNLKDDFLLLSVLATALAVISSHTTPAVASSFVSNQLIDDHIVKRTLDEEGDVRESNGFIELGLGLFFFVVLLGGCTLRRKLNQILQQARTQGNNQSTTDNGAHSPSAPSQNETRHNRRFKILETILQKVRFCKKQQ